MLIVLFVFHAIYFPLETAFFAEREPPIMLDIDLTFEVVLIANCILHFNTAYFNRRGELVQTRHANARQDARGWFIPDLLSSIPVELILAAGGDISNGRSWFHLVADGIFRT